MIFLNDHIQRRYHRIPINFSSVERTGIHLSFLRQVTQKMLFISLNWYLLFELLL